MEQAKKGLKLFDTIAFAFSAIFVLDSFAAAAAIGWSSIIYWVVLAVFYFLPYGLITSELGATYSDGGGIYTWVKRAFGGKWAARTNWIYWLNIGLWMSSVYIAFASSLSAMFFANHPLSLWTQIIIALSITWVTVIFGLINIKYMKWIPNLSSLTKVVLTLALISAAITWLAQDNPVMTPINGDFGIVPSWTTGIVFLPVIIYNLSGFELSSNTVKDMKNPKRDLPLSILLAGITIIVAYVIGTVAVNIVMNVKYLDISNGIIQTITKVFPKWLTSIFGFCLLFTFFGNMITWTSGGNRAIQEAATDGEFPKVLATKLKNGAPLWATIITGIVTTVLLIIAGLISGQDAQISGLFWQLYAFSSINFLLPYLLIFPSFLLLRKKEPNVVRPFRIPGNSAIQLIVTILPMIILVLTIILFLFGDIIAGQKSIAWNDGGQFVVITIIGNLITLFVGEVLIYWSRRHNRQRVNKKQASKPLAQ